jgi:hypothetical protein
LYDCKDHAHDKVAQKPVLLDLGQLEYDELLSGKINLCILAHILVTLAGQELPAVQLERFQIKVFVGHIFAFQNSLIVAIHIMIEILKAMFFGNVFIVVLDEPCQCHFLL